MKDDDVSDDVGFVKPLDQALVVLPEADVETREVEGAVERRAVAT
jgi:hypothetical protein